MIGRSMFCIHGSARHPANELLGTGGCADVIGKEPVDVDQFGGLIVDQCHAADLTRPVGMDDIVVRRGEIDDFGEGITDLAAAIVEAEQADLPSPSCSAAAPANGRIASPSCTRSWPATSLTLAAGTSSMRSTTARRSARRPPSMPRNRRTGAALDAAAAGPSAMRARPLLHFQLHAADLSEPRRVH